MGMEPFSKIPDADSLLKIFPSWPDRDHNPAFRSVGICCSTSLFSTDPEATPTSVFLQGYGASVVGAQIICTVLEHCVAGLGKDSANELAGKIKDLASQHGLGNGHQGHILQIFLKRTCVDKLAYASMPMGVPDRERTPLSKHMNGNSVIRGQARIVANPLYFMYRSCVRLFVSSASEEFHTKRSSFQEKLVELLKPFFGAPAHRAQAANHIFGGRLPSWWESMHALKIECKPLAQASPCAKAPLDVDEPPPPITDSAA